MFVFSTGTTGTIGRQLPSGVLPLNVRLNQNFNISDELSDVNSFSIIHLAAVVGENNLRENPAARRVNVEAAIELGRQALERGVSKFLYVSTSHVYAPSVYETDEASQCSPITEYGSQKYEAELGLREVFAEAPEKLVIARVFSLLDFGMPYFSLGGLASRIISERGRIDVNYSNDVRDFLDLQACADAIYCLAINQTASQTYNICSGKPLSVKEALSMFATKNGAALSDVNFIKGTSSRPFQVGRNNLFLNEFPSKHLKWKFDLS